MKQIIFVYNANSGFINSAIDVLHKSLKPSTYECQLCALTYSGVRMNKQWRAFVNGLPYPALFLHKDEFAKHHPTVTIELPTILYQAGTSFEPIVTAQEFAKIGSLDELIAIVEQRVA